jgi:uncharacterized protein YcbK (DUF882 family)
MRKTSIRAALAAALVLTLAPAVATAPVASAQSARTAAQQVEAPDSQAAHVHDEAPRVAPGQERADFHAWLARAPEHRAAVKSFRDHLKANGVHDVMPIWQLVRTSSSWRECSAGRFEVAPRDKWDNIVTTLKFIERDVEPVVGDVQAVSGYRNAQLNSCSNGAPASAHRLFFALDLMPVDEDVSRGQLVSKVCAAHARDGRAFKTGLGFYNGVRFHIDSNGFRKWGPNGSGATSPCVTGA